MQLNDPAAPGAAQAFVFSAAGSQDAQKATCRRRGSQRAPQARTQAQQAAGQQQAQVQAAASQQAAAPPQQPPSEAARAAPAASPPAPPADLLGSPPSPALPQAPFGRPVFGRRVMRAKRPREPEAAAAAADAPAQLAECLQRLDGLPDHLRDYILALAVSWELGRRRVRGCSALGAEHAAASATAATKTRDDSDPLLMQDAAEQLEPLAAERLDVRQLVWRYAQVCRRSRLHRRLARATPFQAVLPASELLPNASKLRGCLAWLGGLRLASLQLTRRPLGAAGLAELAGLMAELAPQHGALIAALR